jgi:hypothetical protein
MSLYLPYIMEEIVVNKKALKGIRDSIDTLLKSGGGKITIHPQFASDESAELSGREKKILKYIEKNQGTTKEEVIKKNPDLGSRMTIVKSINNLIEMRMLMIRPDDLNRHIQHLYPNNENVILALINDLESFKQVYFRLIDETGKKLKELWFKYRKKVDLGRHTKIWLDMRRLLQALLMPYKNLALMYITSDLLLYRERPLDKKTLRNKFAIIGDSVIEIQTKLHESIIHLFSNDFYEAVFLEPTAAFDFSNYGYVADYSLYSIDSRLSREHLISFLRDYWAVRLGAYAEPVLDILWKISYPVLINDVCMCDDPETLKDWRNVISASKEFNYIPKTTQAQNLGKLLR